MALDSVYSLPPTNLPTPADSPVENAAVGITRKLSRNGQASRNSNRLSNLFPDNQTFLQRHHTDQDMAPSEKRSSMDAFRFTSNLDNSLLQQIHALRSELEDKNKIIEGLEDDLQHSTAQNNVLTQDLNKSKSLKKHMQLLENESLSALDDLAKERDVAIESMGDYRRRLETSNQKLRTAQEDAQKLQEMRDKEEQSWAEERRNMDRKLHVMENRLKTMVAEMVAAESKGVNRPETSSSDYEGMHWVAKPDTFSIRSGSRPESRMSNRSLHEPRDSQDFQRRPPSRLSALQEVGESTSSLHLADELAGEDFDQEENDQMYDPALPSPGALPEELGFRRNRYSEDQKAREVMGLLRKSHDGPHEYPVTGESQRTVEKGQSEYGHAQSAYAYTDTAAQTSPPSSPTLLTPISRDLTAKPESQAHTTELVQETLRNVKHHDESIERPIIFAECSTQTEPVSNAFSQATQTTDVPVPASPKTTEKGIQTDASLEILEQSASGLKLARLKEQLVTNQPNLNTKVVPIHADTGKSAKDDADLTEQVPTIAIHPPGSRPSSSHNSVKLPPGTKNAATSANIELPRNIRSMSTQTSESFSTIQPPPRQSSGAAISRIHEKYKLSSNAVNPKSSRRKLKSPPPHLRDDPPPASPPISTFKDVFSSTNDNGPLNSKSQHGPRRPIRSASILAGFSDDNETSDQEKAANLSDDELRTAPAIRRKLEKVKDSWRLIPTSGPTELDRIESMSEPEPQVNDGRTRVVKDGPVRNASGQKTLPKDVLPNTSKKVVSKQSSRRVTASTISSTASQFQRSRTPSVPSISTGSTSQRGPPLPVPTRHSSRKVPLSASDGAASPTLYATSYFTTRQQNLSGHSRSKRKTLRYSRSAAVTEPSSPTDLIPPLPTALVSNNPPRTPVTRRKNRAQTQPRDSFEVKQIANRYGSTSPRTATVSESVDQQGSDVIHAVTQTMIGEWMFKYVRKRKSFGVKDNPQHDLDKGAVGATRHRRWVWVLPRERAVVWSDKEPTTAHAIGGKGARKLIIQSVVDVPDTAIPPRGYNASHICDRSILILTPERALKLTAISRERHYIWLTSLSYISSSDFNLTLVEGPPPSPLRTPTRHGSIYSRRELRDRDRDRELEEEIRPSEEAAEAPQVPRVSSYISQHSRKRSSTGPGKPPLPLSAFHSYPNNAVATASSYDVWNPQPPLPMTGTKERSASGPTTMTTATEGRVVPNNVFDAIGTVRMEAFIEEEFPIGGVSSRLGDGEAGGRKRSESRGKRKDMMAYWGVSDDPFRGF